MRVARARNAGPKHRRWCLSLRYDKRQKGARRLSLAVAFPQLKLKAGDFARTFLMSAPSSAFHLSLLKACRCLSDGPRTRRCVCAGARCLNRDIGLFPNTAVALDLLRTNHLGVMLVYCRHVVWEFLRSGVWGVAPSKRTETFKTSVFGCSVRVVGLVRVQAAEPPHRELDSSC